MKRPLSIILFLLASGTGARAQLTVERIMQDPKIWMGTSPSREYWGEDSKTLFFDWNPDAAPDDSLYRYGVSEKKIKKVSSAERKVLPAGDGVYNRLRTLKVYTRNGDVFLLDCKTFKVRQMTSTVETESSPSFSGDEQRVVFERDDNLYSIALASGLLTQHTDFKKGTKKAEGKKTEEETWLEQDQIGLFLVLKERKDKKDAAKKIGEAEKPSRPKEIYLGEKRVSSQQLSPDGRFVTYRLSKSDKASRRTIVPSFVTQSGFTEDLPARTKVGDPATEFEFWVYDIQKDTMRQVSTKKLPGISDKPDYLKEYPKLDTAWKSQIRPVIVHGPAWSEDGRNAVVVVRSLDNKDRWIMAFDPDSLSLKSLDRQRDEAWIGGPGVGGYAQSAGELGWINNSTIYFQSEADGYAHLYSLDVRSGEKKQLTKGKFEVASVVLSQDKRYFYLTTNEVHPGQKHYYRMAVTGGARTQLTTGIGAHEVTLSPDETKLAVRYSTSTTPWELFVVDNKAGAKPLQITHSTTEQFKAYPWREAKLVTIEASDGATIHARLYAPEKSNRKAVIFVHGAGYLQNAHAWWSNYFREYMFHNLLVEKGYTVLDMDYRASAGYGRDWRTAIYRHMGGKDLSDNVDGAKWLVKNHKIDPEKIGIYGGSYGGFITLMALFTTPDVFKAGAALRPVTDWAAYNHPYTANILNEPQRDSLAYRRSSPIYFASGLKNHLLICHGMVDVNVHFQDVARLSQRLIELGKDQWELAVYPLEDHGFVEPSSWTDEYKRILNLFEENLR